MIRARSVLWFAVLGSSLACSSDDPEQASAPPGSVPGVGVPGGAAPGVGQQAPAGGAAGAASTPATSVPSSPANTEAGNAVNGETPLSTDLPGTASGSVADGGSPDAGKPPVTEPQQPCAGPVGTIAGSLANGVNFIDTDGQPVNAHGGGIIQVGNTFYMHGERFLDTTTDNNFYGVSMYSSTDLATWKNEGIILPQQQNGELGPNRKGERPHIIQCPSTGEFVVYVHAASVDYQMDREVVYATSPTVNGQYTYRGRLTNANGQIAAHSDMGAYADETGGYVVTESGHVYTLTDDCHSWVSDRVFGAVNGDSGGSESPAVFRANGTYYWIGSYKTGWRANNNFYSTAPAMTGPWTFRGYVAPVTDAANNISDQRTWLSQSTWVQPVKGCNGTTFVYWGDHWNGNLDTRAPGRDNYLATYVFQPLVFNGINISMPTYHASWKLDVGAGTWSE